MPNIKPNYAEFSDLKLASVYNSVNLHYPLEKDFYLNLAKSLSASKIIDIGCGTGLLTLELARLGYEMTGVEPAKAMLDIARQSPEADRVKWIEGDALKLKKLTGLNQSDADLAMMTAHVAQFLLDDNYFLDCLKSINKSLKIGGHLVFDSRNTLAEIASLGWPTEKSPRKGKNLNSEDVSWWAEPLETNGNRAIYEIHYLFVQTGQKYVSVNELVFRTKAEITEFLRKAGFEVENIYGDWDQTSVTNESPELIFVARKI